MVKQHILNEGDLPPKLPVIFSDEIADRIRDIRFYNQFDKEGLSRLFSYIKGIKNHISNRAIAFSYGSASYSYGASIIYDFGVGFCLEDDSEKVYVKVVWLDLNLEDFGLNENRHIDKIITEVINQNTTNEFVSVSEFKYKGKDNFIMLVVEILLRISHVTYMVLQSFIMATLIIRVRVQLVKIYCTLLVVVHMIGLTTMNMSL